MSPICDFFVFYFYIYIYNTQKSQSFRALTSSYCTFFHDMLSFNQIFLVYGYGCNFFSLFVLCQTILKNKFKSIYRILSRLASLYRRWFHSCSKVLIYKEVILFLMRCIKLFFIYVYTKYISCYCSFVDYYHYYIMLCYSQILNMDNNDVNDIVITYIFPEFCT